MRIRRTILAVVAGVMLATTLPTTAHAAAARPDPRPSSCPSTRVEQAHRGQVAGYPDPDRWLGNRGKRRPHKLVIGDSITYRGYRSLGLRSLEVTAAPGRNVGTMECYLRDRLANRRSRLHVVVMALGTNASPWWTYADFKRMVALVAQASPRTRIVMVSTYRTVESSPERWGIRSAASTSVTYARWMRVIAGWSSRVCLADWSSYAASRPWSTVDGVHPSPKGTIGWAGLIRSAVHTAMKGRC